MQRLSRKTTTQFESLNSIGVGLADSFRPPERITVSEAAEKYVQLNIPGAYMGPYRSDLTPYMVEPSNVLASRQFDACVFVGAAQSGKALPLWTPIATPSGWSTMGRLRVGDEVFGSDGKPTKVVFATGTMHGHDCYQVVFDDGSTVTADAEHLWTVDDLRFGGKKTLTTVEILKGRWESRANRARFAIPNAAPIETPEADLPLDPYAFGAWLGDGDSGHSRVSLNASDGDIADRIEAAGYPVARVKVEDAHTLTIKPHISFRHALAATGAMLRPGERGTRKRIPPCYLRASVAQRRALLHGLMDTDGSVGRAGVCEITTVIPALADDIEELLVSLGFKVRRALKETTCRHLGVIIRGQADRITFVTADCPFLTARKVAMFEARALDGRVRKPSYTGRRFITDVRPVSSVPVRCIQVDALDHLFLAGRQMVPTHNTQSLLLNWLAYNIMVDPMDMMFFSPSHSAARDFAVRRVDRMHRHSPAIGAMLSPRADEDNRHEKVYRNGSILTLSWPSVTEFAGRPVGRIALTDFDRMDDDIDGDGNPFDLAAKRTTTFGSFAMTLAESSPSRPLEDPRWIATTAHEAPPVKGILALYNRGDRRRWYWRCPKCSHRFEGNFRMLKWEPLPDRFAAAETVRLVCPSCEHGIPHERRRDLNAEGVWLKDGETMGRDGKISGTAMRSNIASFWLNGVAATFISWPKLVQNYLMAEEEYQKTSGEESLRKFYNNDLAEPYTPKKQETVRLPATLQDRAEAYGEADSPEVPEAVRFLVACVDVQKNMFVVQVFGIAPGNPFDVYVVDRFDIRKSNRADKDGDREWVKPGSYLEDWNVLSDQVINRTYPIQDDPVRRMAVKMTLCDSGGREGVTTNAYAFYRRLRSTNAAGRFHLVKGEPSPTAPSVQVRHPDSQTRATGTKAGAQGDIPVLFINSTMVKDALNNRLDVVEPGAGMFHFPRWLPDWFFAEMCSETRGPKGWEVTKGGRQRNEAWDLSYYLLGSCSSVVLGRVDKFDWKGKVPAWADIPARNPLVSGTKKEDVASPEAPRYKMQRLGSILG